MSSFVLLRKRIFSILCHPEAPSLSLRMTLSCLCHPEEAEPTKDLFPHSRQVRKEAPSLSLRMTLTRLLRITGGEAFRKIAGKRPKGRQGRKGNHTGNKKPGLLQIHATALFSQVFHHFPPAAAAGGRRNQHNSAQHCQADSALTLTSATRPPPAGRSGYCRGWRRGP